MSTRQYLNNLIEESYSLFTRIKSGVRKAGLVALVGTIIGVDVYGCKKEEPVRKDTAPIESVEQDSTALKQLDRVIEWELNEGNKNFGIWHAARLVFARRNHRRSKDFQSVINRSGS